MLRLPFVDECCGLTAVLRRKYGGRSGPPQPRLFFTETPVVDYASAQQTDGKRYARFFHEMLDRGVYLAPSPFEALFPSLAHGPAEIDEIITAAAEAAAAL